MIVTGNKIFLKQEEHKSAVGIITPLKKQGYDVFEVVACGPGEWNPFTGKQIPMSVKVGDRVVADVVTAPEVTIIKDGVRNNYRVISEKDIMIVLDKDEEVQ